MKVVLRNNEVSSEENGLDVYLDLETGQECFRPQSSCSKVLEG